VERWADDNEERKQELLKDLVQDPTYVGQRSHILAEAFSELSEKEQARYTADSRTEAAGAKAGDDNFS
jgi:hypothetical protein